MLLSCVALFHHNMLACLRYKHSAMSVSVLTCYQSQTLQGALTLRRWTGGRRKRYSAYWHQNSRLRSANFCCRPTVAVDCGGHAECAVLADEPLRLWVTRSLIGAGEKITPDEVWERMEEDVQAADLILWVGISFEQSASTVYFRRVRQFLAQADRLSFTQQAIINLSDESLWNLLSACSNTSKLLSPFALHLSPVTLAQHQRQHLCTMVHWPSAFSLQALMLLFWWCCH